MCDFGFSKHEQHHSQPGSRVGTPAYFAPEFLQATNMGETYDGKVGKGEPFAHLDTRIFRLHYHQSRSSYIRTNGKGLHVSHELDNLENK